MTAVDAALAEIEAELVRIAPIHEGLRDYYLLDIKDETKVQVATAISQYDRRVQALNNAKVNLVALLGDGYPALDIAPVEKAVYDDLKENEATIAAALAKFSMNEAVAVTIVPGTPVEKP